MSDLSDFLLARIDEDENIARRTAAMRGLHWRVEPVMTPTWTPPATEPKDTQTGTAVWGDDTGSFHGFYFKSAQAADGVVAEHLGNWDPARVLAECTAKRAIVEAHPEEERLAEVDPELGEKAPACTADWEPFPCTTLRLLALPYVDHPDYREEWRP